MHACSSTPARDTAAWAECGAQARRCAVLNLSRPRPRIAPHSALPPPRPQLSALGIGGADADLALRKALGWGFQGYWRKEKEDEAADPVAVSARIAFLRAEVGLSDDQLAATLRAFPEALGLDVESRMRPNMAFLEKTYRLSGAALAATVVRKPAVLGNNLDCAGDCAGECNRCWVRF